MPMKLPKTDINYFLAVLVAGSMLSLWFLAPIIHIAFMYAGVGLNGIISGNIVAISIVFVAMIIVWKKNSSFAPTAIVSGSESRYRIGTILTALSNIIVLGSLVVSIYGYYAIPDFGLVIGFLVPAALLLAAPISIVGILCVEASRQRK